MIKRREIGLMFGSFNPPHLGHVETADKVRKDHGLAQVWLFPVPVSSFKKGTLQATFYEKVEMCEILAAPYRDWLRVFPACSNFKEGYLGQLQSLKRSIERLERRHPLTDFYLVAGEDFNRRFSLALRTLGMANFIGSMMQSKMHLNLPLIAQVNQRIAMAYATFESTPRLISERSSLTSSSRERAILAGKSHEISYVPKEVQNYIAAHYLYRSYG